MPDAATHFGPAPPRTADSWRRNHSAPPGATLIGTAGDLPPTLGYSSHSVPLASFRSPGAPRLMPSRFTVPFTSVVPNDVHISASGSWTSATDAWFWYAQMQVRVYSGAVRRPPATTRLLVQLERKPPK